MNSKNMKYWNGKQTIKFHKDRKHAKEVRAAR